MKKILATCFFPAFTPQLSGGEIKLFCFYEALSKFYHIDLITLGYPTRSETIRHNTNFVEHRVAKPHNIGDFYASLNDSNINGDLCHLVACHLGNTFDDLKKCFDSLVEDASLIFHDFPFGFNLDNVVLYPDKIRVYNSHNFELGLALSAIEDISGTAYRVIMKAESDLIKHCDYVFAMSQQESAAFNYWYECEPSKIFNTPMGFSTSLVNPKYLSDDRLNIVFVGSDHLPNIAAVNSLVQLCASIDELYLRVAGKICESIAATSIGDNVELLGVISEEEKSELYSKSDVFVSFIKEGAGVNVKMIEAMSFGLHIVSNDFGLRGVNTTNYSVTLISDLEEIPGRIDSIRSKAKNHGIRKKNIDAAFQNHSYDKIAENVFTFIENKEKKANTTSKPINLFLNDYSPGNAYFGGAKRIHRLLSSTPNHQNVLVSFTDDSSLKFDTKNNDFIEVLVPKTQEHKDVEILVNEGMSISATDMVNMVFAPRNAILMKLFKTLLKRSSSVTFCHCYMSSLLPYIEENIRKSIKVIYDSHNFESNLKRELFANINSPKINALVDGLENFEYNLIRNADKIICVSNEDKNRFIENVQASPSKFNVVLNGCDVSDFCPERTVLHAEGIVRLVFLGSAHPPNVEGIKQFIKEDLAFLSNVTLELIGSVCDALNPDSLARNITLHGVVDERTKNHLLNSAHIAINPVKTGGGSSLKIADYMSAGLPVITSQYGSRGFSLKSGKHLIITNDFTKAIKKLVLNDELRSEIGSSAYQWAKSNLDWKILSKSYMDLVENNVQHSHNVSQVAKSLLLITYRYCEPNIGGGESYLYEISKKLSENHNVNIDLITLNVKDFEEKSGYYLEQRGSPFAHNTILGEPYRNLKYFELDDCDLQNQMISAEKVENQKVEDLNFCIDVASDYFNETCFDLGWHSVEISDTPFMWSKGIGTISVEAHASSIRFVLYSPEEKHTRVYVDGSVELDITVFGSKPIVLAFDPIDSKHKVVIQTSPEFIDGRELGIVISEVFVQVENNEKQVDLGLSGETLLNLMDSYTKTKLFKEMCMRRSNDIGSHFTKVRGGTSKEMIEYIDAVAEGYDAVILHGVQFQQTINIAHHLLEKGISYINLPHCHPDDAFYHWRSMYEVMSGAQKLVTFESKLQIEFAETLNSDLIIVPGGGVDLNEQQSLDPNRWEQVKEENFILDDYFIVVGRKSPSKNYREIVETFEKSMLKFTHSLVLIGPDEDGEVIDSHNVVYLGRQSRNVLLTAINESLGLISMSTSESFGMVITEAWLMKTPVIVTCKCEAFTELVDDRVNGIVVDGNEQLDSAMLLLSENQTIRTQFGQKGYEKVVSFYSWETIADKYHDKIFGG